jgi:hypothetical protein
MYLIQLIRWRTGDLVTRNSSASLITSTRTKIGEGGFGFVYAGRLENGVSVAVKMRSEESLQGNTEFLAEVHVNYFSVHQISSCVLKSIPGL